jgi:polysaccharide biosynthesis transport protein
MRENPANGYDQLPALRNSYMPSQEEKGVHLRDYWKVILKRRWIVISLLLIAVAATAVKTFTMRPIFRGITTIQINIENPQVLDFKEVFAINVWAMDYYQTQYNILESQSLALRVVKALKLLEHPEFLPEPETPVQRWRSNLRASFLDFFPSFRKEDPASDEGLVTEKDPLQDEKEASLVGQILGRLKVEPIRNSRLVKIHFDSYYPDLSARAANTLAQEYIRMNMENRFTNTEQAKEWLTKQLEELKAKVERADEALHAFGSKHDIISLEEKENLTMKRLAELNEELAKSESDRMAKEAIYKQVQQIEVRNSDTLLSILDNKLIQDLKQSYIQLETQYVKLSETFKPDYPEMVRLKNQMESIQKRLDGEIKKIAASIRNEYESSLRRESLQRQAFKQQKAKAMEMNERAIQYNILKREADTNREIYKSLLQRLKEIGVSAGVTASNIQVIDQAKLPRGPYKPNIPRNLLFATAIGLFLGMGLAFFFEYLDNTVKTPEDVTELSQLPSLGMVPEISSERRRRLGKKTATVYPVELITFGHPKSMLSEAYRNIRTSILFSFSERPPKKIVFTSPNPFEGKTTTLINTAIALSQIGARVMIIDADMRKPRVHKLFSERNGSGLSTFLSGNAKLASVVKRSDIPNLYYIPAGPVPPNPSELLNSSLFRNMLTFLEQKFDQIMIDSPPALGFSDSAILSTAADGVILVVSGGKTPKGTLQRAKDAFVQVNAKILGVVINRVNIQQYDYKDYYYRYHYYQSYYGKEMEKRKPPLRVGSGKLA